eukprot:8154148-Pyramimonas_sp.AAC.1
MVLSNQYCAAPSVYVSDSGLRPKGVFLWPTDVLLAMADDEHPRVRAALVQRLREKMLLEEAKEHLAALEDTLDSLKCVRESSQSALKGHERVLARVFWVSLENARSTQVRWRD